MQRLKALWLALIAAFAVSAIASASAWALPEFLGTLPTTFTGTSGAGELVSGGLSIKCKKDTSSGTFENSKHGTFSVDFKECTGPLNEACNSLGDASGIILVTGNALSAFDSLSPLGAALILLVEPEVHIICHSIKEELILVKGAVLALVLPINVKTKKFELLVEVEAGKQKETEYWNDSGVKVKLADPLLSSLNGGVFKESTEESKENKIETVNELTLDA